MKEETATEVYGSVIALDPLINKLFESADAVEDETLRSQFKKAVGEVMGRLYFEIMLPLEKLYPALIPDTERPRQRTEGVSPRQAPRGKPTPDHT